MDSIDYAVIGFLILIFIFQLIIIWYIWYGQNQALTDYNDLNDMIIDIYNLEVLEAIADGRCATLNIPKHAREAYLKRHQNVTPPPCPPPCPQPCPHPFPQPCPHPFPPPC
jgi:hypothetical protein